MPNPNLNDKSEMLQPPITASAFPPSLLCYFFFCALDPHDTCDAATNDPS
jgi:hypothetical protein